MDAIIIGAGAAGLAAARELARARRSVLVLEARDRIGGRCWSRHEPGLEMPIEYGAEFIHGRPAATFALLDRAGIGVLERTGTRWFVKLPTAGKASSPSRSRCGMRRCPPVNLNKPG